MTLGGRIAESRKKQGMTQREMAAQLGITNVYLCYIEKQNKGLHLNTFVNICVLLGESADWLLFGKGNPK